MRTLTLIITLLAASLLFTDARAETGMTDKELEQHLWQLELEIYSQREKGNMQFYADQISPGYMAWPPQFERPMALGKMAAERPANAAPLGGEKLALSLSGFTRDGATALIYYTTHRTARAGGAPVDEWFETIHVWAEIDGAWKLVGGMARPRPENRAQIGNQ